jgi:hypothetical protein
MPAKVFRGRNIFYTLVIKSLHLLPSNIKQVAHDINKFKHNLKKFLILNYFSSVEDYLDRDNRFKLGVFQ